MTTLLRLTFCEVVNRLLHGFLFWFALAGASAALASPGDTAISLLKDNKKSAVTFVFEENGIYYVYYEAIPDRGLIQILSSDYPWRSYLPLIQGSPQGIFLNGS